MAQNSAPPETDQPAPPPPGTPAGAPSGSGFFDWLRSLNVPRTPGWIGGVAGGVAARLGIDPIIVRGVLVVFALFGAPAFLAYGAAWLLLPDTTGRIHLEQAIRGVWDSALVGIGVFLLVGILPWGWAWGPLDWDVPFNPFNPFNPLGVNLWPVLWTVAGIAGIVWFIVWVVRRSRADAATGGAGTDASAGSAGTDASAGGEAGAGAGAAAASAPGTVPDPTGGAAPTPRPRRAHRTEPPSTPRGRPSTTPGGSSTTRGNGPRPTRAVPRVRRPPQRTGPAPPSSPRRPKRLGASGAAPGRGPVSRTWSPRSARRSRSGRSPPSWRCPRPTNGIPRAPSASRSRP
ncbi:hypothetical protein GCM10025870_13530 [Agromyces marinus]|uniref:Phage shock protein PspC N-terminal domain-containing protein n=1 Tax=Agromyces marinus TaxID=1389020 RepID=A0ABM8H0J8_9MICO|nr:PspC domain-containing protein [Agromyces marinus]BDZ54280.1 hypothetical protein GCM10025870_13530 [Agromyces marinus]